jgi:hypothetical protein
MLCVRSFFIFISAAKPKKAAKIYDLPLLLSALEIIALMVLLTPLLVPVPSFILCSEGNFRMPLSIEHHWPAYYEY